MINRSSKTGGCKGCAFILFKHEAVAKTLIDNPNRHPIGDKMVEVKSCHRKGTKSKAATSTTQSKKKQNNLKCKQCHQPRLNTQSNPFNFESMTKAEYSPQQPMQSPKVEIKYTPLDDLNNDVLNLEQPVKRLHKKSKTFEDLPEYDEEFKCPSTPRNEIDIGRLSPDDIDYPPLNIDDLCDACEDK